MPLYPRRLVSVCALQLGAKIASDPKLASRVVVAKVSPPPSPPPPPLRARGRASFRVRTPRFHVLRKHPSQPCLRRSVPYKFTRRQSFMGPC